MKFLFVLLTLLGTQAFAKTVTGGKVSLTVFRMDVVLENGHYTQKLTELCEATFPVKVNDLRNGGYQPMDMFVCEFSEKGITYHARVFYAASLNNSHSGDYLSLGGDMFVVSKDDLGQPTFPVGQSQFFTTKVLSLSNASLNLTPGIFGKCDATGKCTYNADMGVGAIMEYNLE